MKSPAQKTRRDTSAQLLADGKTRERQKWLHSAVHLGCSYPEPQKVPGQPPATYEQIENGDAFLDTTLTCAPKHVPKEERRQPPPAALTWTVRLSGFDDEWYSRHFDDETAANTCFDGLTEPVLLEELRAQGFERSI